MRVADAIFQRVKQETDTVYTVPGGGAMYLVDALGRSGLRYVPAIHEQGAGFMALGHAMLTGFGCCLVTSGPGASNAITACLAAWTDSIPVLFISGQARSDTLAPAGMRSKGVQEANIIAMVEPITKWAIELEPHFFDVIDIDMNSLIKECKSGRPGPCWLSVPQDIQGVEI